MAELWKSFLASVDRLFERRQFKSLKELFAALEPADVAEILAEKPPTERVFLFRLLQKDQAIEVFEFLGGAAREELMAHFTDSEVASIIEEMSDDDRTALFDELPAETVTRLLSHLSPKERRLANALLNYPPDTAGHIMTPEFVDLKEGMDASQAIDRIRATAAKKETIYTSFVVGSDRRLKGTVHLEDLILADPRELMSDLMDANPVFVSTCDDREEAVRTMSRYDLQTLPVVDSDGRMVGILTFDDMIDVIQEETTEDFERMAGVSPVEEGYMNANVVTLSRKRLNWLLICIVTQLFSTFVLQRYSFALESVVALAFFIPMLIGTGGNSGTQASTLVVRGMTLGEIEPPDAWRVAKKEILTGLVLGAALAVMAYFRAWHMGAGPGVALTVAISIVGVVVMGNLVGGLLPFAAEKLGTDPAIMSGPLITTVVDVLGLLFYFEVARTTLGLFQGL
ncbi:MAG: magnesium transporter [Synergistaceae bacterium]|nr:magnesium transporter [Synergistaceae bacterium]